MADSYSPNKALGLQATGSNNDTWGVDLNSSLTTIDTALGGSVQVIVTGVAAGAYTLALAQYQPPNIEFEGTLSGNLTYLVPGGVGGIWSVWNNTSGSYTLTFASANLGSTVVIPQGQRALVICDGTYMMSAQTGVVSANPIAQVGTTAVNGTLGTFMTSDSAPAINQGMSPTWTGTHTFDGQVNLVGPVALDGNMTVNLGTIINASEADVLVATQSLGDNSTHPATTAFVQAAIPGILANAALTGTPTTPTAAAGTNNTQVASTAFAVGPAKNLAANGYSELPSGLIIQWGINSFSSGGSAITFSAVGGIAFPNNCFMALANAYGSAATAYVVSKSTTTLTAVNGISSTNSWIAVGN